VGVGGVGVGGVGVGGVGVGGVGTSAGRGLVLTCDLFLAFPISGIDLLGKDTKTVQSARLTDTAYLVLDSVRETCIEVVTQGAITVTHLGCDTVEVNHVSIGTMVFLHAEVVELMLSVGNWVVGTEGCLEFNDELFSVGHPDRMVVGVSCTE